MALITVDRALKARKYTKLGAFYDDLMQIWDNCKAYNTETSVIYNMSVDLETIMNQLFVERGFDPELHSFRMTEIKYPPKRGAKKVIPPPSKDALLSSNSSKHYTPPARPLLRS